MLTVHSIYYTQGLLHTVFSIHSGEGHTHVVQWVTPDYIYIYAVESTNTEDYRVHSGYCSHTVNIIHCGIEQILSKQSSDNLTKFRMYKTELMKNTKLLKTFF